MFQREKASVMDWVRYSVKTGGTRAGARVTLAVAPFIMLLFVWYTAPQPRAQTSATEAVSAEVEVQPTDSATRQDFILKVVR